MKTQFYTILLFFILLTIPFSSQAWLVHDSVHLETFDFITVYEGWDTPERTFPENIGSPLSAALLDNGNVAMLFYSDLSTLPSPWVVYAFNIDIDADPVWSITGGPYFIQYSPNTEVGLSSICKYDGGKLAILAHWQETLPDSSLAHHYYALDFDIGASNELSLIAEFSGDAAYSYQEMLWLPPSGSFDAGWALYKTSERKVQLADSLGIVDDTNSIYFADIALNGPGEYSGAAGLDYSLSNGDLLVLGFEEGASSGDHYNAAYARVTRDGIFHGAVNVGECVYPDNLISGAQGLCELGDGTILVWGVYESFGNGHTHRFYVVRPDTSFYEPYVKCTPTYITPQCKVGDSLSIDIDIYNIGNSLSQITNMYIEDPTSGGVGHPESYSIQNSPPLNVIPTYGKNPTDTDMTTINILFEPATVGSHKGRFKYETSPTEPKGDSATLYGFALPASWVDTILIDMASLVSDATALGAIDFESGENKLIIIVHRDGGSRIIKVPVTRDGSNNITGFNTGSIDIIADIEYSKGGILEDSDGMLWYSRGNDCQYLIQRKPDGTTFEQNIEISSGSGPNDFDFAPEISTLVLSVENSFCIWKCPLTLNGNGFYELGSMTKLLHILCSLVKVWPMEKTTLPGLMCGVNLYEGSEQLWNGETTSGAAYQTIANSLDIVRYCRDDVTGDMLYVDSSGNIHRVDGMEAYTSEPQSVKPINWELYN